MLTEIISAIQVGMEAGKFAEELYNGEHFEDVKRAYDLYSAIDFDGDIVPEIQEVLQCLESVNNDDRLHVKVAAWNLRAWCYAHIGDYTKARQNIARVLNAQVDSLTLYKDVIAEYKKQCRELQSEIKRVEHPEPQYYVETRRQGNQHNNSPKKNKSKSKETAIIVTTKQYSRGDLLNIIAGCDNNPLSYSEDSIINSSPKELRLALQANGISISTSAIAGFNTYRGLINYILEHTQPGASPTSSSKPTVAQQKSTSRPNKQALAPFVLPIEDKFYIEGRGTVVTGRVAVGKVEVGDELFVVNPSGNKYKTVCQGIEMFKKLLTQAEEGDNCGILLPNVSVSSIQEGAWLQKGEQTIDMPTPVGMGRKSTTVPMSANKGVTSSLSEEEQEYVEMYKEYVADGEISERDRKMLDKFRSRLGISEERARELEKSCSKPQLTEDEKEYLEMYKEYAADGEISERDRKMLNKMRDKMGISEERAREIEKL